MGAARRGAVGGRPLGSAPVGVESVELLADQAGGAVRLALLCAEYEVERSQHSGLPFDQGVRMTADDGPLYLSSIRIVADE